MTPGTWGMDGALTFGGSNEQTGSVNEWRFVVAPLLWPRFNFLVPF